MMEDNGITNGKKSNFSNNQKGGEILVEKLQKGRAGLKSTSTVSTSDAKAATGVTKAATGDAKATTGDAKKGDAKTSDAKKGDAKEKKDKKQNKNKIPKSNAPPSSVTIPGAPGSVKVVNIGEEDNKPLTKKEINKQKRKDLKANLKEAKEKRKANQASRREAREKKREKDKATKEKYMSGSFFERAKGYVMKGLSAVSIVLVVYGVVLFPIVICAVFLYMVLKKCFTTLMKL